MAAILGIDPAAFRAIVDGSRRGWRASLARGALRVAETPYACAMRWRNWRYDRGRARVTRVSVPVISVGNLTLGGTGKTPMVAWLARWLRQQDVRVTLISRGYGAEATGRNDEALELELQLPDVPHLQNPDRVAAAQLAIEEFECQMILLDDGFQHRRLAREVDIVLLDAGNPFGCGHVFPRGLLREPLSALSRAHVVVLSRADMVDQARRDEIRHAVERWAPQAAWAEAAHEPIELRAADGSAAPLNALEGRPVAAFCGIGNPAGFGHTLQSLGYRVAGFREFADHHAYTRDDLEMLRQWGDELNAAALVCTQKDLVKIGVNRLGTRPLWAVAIGLKFLSGEEALHAAVRPLLPH